MYKNNQKNILLLNMKLKLYVVIQKSKNLKKI
jgi:hypothetical protein